MTPAALIEQELAAAQTAQQNGNDGKARSLCSTRRGLRHRGVDCAAPFLTMVWGCDGTAPTHSAGPILPSSYPPGGRAIEYLCDPSARRPLHNRSNRRRETHHRPPQQHHFRQRSPITTSLPIHHPLNRASEGVEKISTAAVEAKLKMILPSSLVIFSGMGAD